ncbi:MAG: adenylate/guanylate cyclase domain-containing protein [Deltaproteobacteria bacterium]|nr:adenylate/guanylate cyclase domain-containing protein [Deltaproteobacteria bacterium]
MKKIVVPAKGRKIFQGICAGFIGAVAAVALWLPGWLDRWEYQAWDWRVSRFAAPGAATDKIRLIFLDQKSLDWGEKENGLSWPWPREVYGPLINFCKRGGARAVAFDVVFTEASTYGVADDEAFGKAIEDSGIFIGSVFLGRQAGDTRWPAGLPSASLEIQGFDRWSAGDGDETYRFSHGSFAIPEVTTKAKRLGNVHLNPDEDSVYRRTSLFGIFDGRTVPSLALAAYLLDHSKTSIAISKGALRVDGAVIPIDGGGRAVLNFRGPSGTHKAFSAAAVIQSELKIQAGEAPSILPEEFKDAYVFFGFSAPGLYDLRPAPVSGIFPGVELHATALDNILSKDFIKPAPAAITLAATICAALLAGLFLSLASGILANLAVCGLTLLVPPALAAASYAAGFWLPMAVQAVALVLTLISAGVIYYSVEGKQKRFIKNAFQQYLSPDVIEEIITHPERLKLGGQRRVLSIFFSDLEGFTTLSEKLEPEELTSFLNEYLSAMTDIIKAEGGTVDKYEGDAIIAFWNAPLDQPDHAVRCVRAALACQKRLAELRPGFRQRLGKDVKMRIGLNTGSAVVGNMGSESRFDYTMLGDAVNLAARLEGINKQFGTYTIVSENTMKALDGAFPARELSRVAVVGRKESVRIYEPFFPADYDSRLQEFNRFGQGLAAFYKGDFAEAIGVFDKLLEGDPAAASYARQCRRLQEEPPEAWGGVWVMTSK